MVPSDDSFFVGRSPQEVCPEVTPEETTFVAQLRFVTLEMAGEGGKNQAKALLVGFFSFSSLHVGEWNELKLKVDNMLVHVDPVLREEGKK